ncbi:BatD family protein [Shewanella sp. KX20019]|uniref:BatD family protein n=1 Tax=Shewanella sp. KX20019 TaxID=2803864 RepID=UPI0019270BF1|nr:BatD family protein [Shewanella sp. KX20019]QQX78366.1 BatD family protein [Shewanella sp. KX20019]
MSANQYVQFRSNEPLDSLFPITASLRSLIKVVAMTSAWLLVIVALFVSSSVFNFSWASSVIDENQHGQPVAAPSSVSELQQAGKLTVKTRLSATTVVSPHQQVDLYIQIWTDTWFGGGAQIATFDVKDTIVLRRKKLANNSTERINGTTWSVQEWQLTLYPQSPGLFTVPVIAVAVNIADKPGSTIKGTVYTEAQSFEVALPDERLSATPNWIAAPKVTFEQKLTPKIGTQLKIGDAITRTLTIKATDSSAMLFPDFPLYQTEMLQGYLGPVESEDRQYRGDFSASKIYQQTYIVQQSGELSLSELSFYWWNTDAKKLVELKVKGQSWSISHTPLSFIIAYWAEGLLLTTLLTVFVFLLRWLYQGYKQQQLPVIVLFMFSLLQKRWRRVEQYLYWHNTDRNHRPTFNSEVNLFCQSEQRLEVNSKINSATSKAKGSVRSALAEALLFSRWQQRFSQQQQAKDKGKGGLTRPSYLKFWRMLSNKGNVSPQRR